MRVLVGGAVETGDAVAHFLRAGAPGVAAVCAVTAADASAGATAAGFQHAVFDVAPGEPGLAIYWKPSLSLRGLSRTEFMPPASGGPRGLLRVTLRWDGRSVDVVCARLSHAACDADRQVAELARELIAGGEPAIVALDTAGNAVPDLPGLDDAVAASGWRTVVLPDAADVGTAARAAFGLPAVLRPDREPRLDDLKLFCSAAYHVSSARRTVDAPGAWGRALSVELRAAAERDAAWPLDDQIGARDAAFSRPARERAGARRP